MESDDLVNYFKIKDKKPPHPTLPYAVLKTFKIESIFDVGGFPLENCLKNPVLTVIFILNQMIQGLHFFISSSSKSFIRNSPNHPVSNIGAIIIAPGDRHKSHSCF